MKKGYGPGEKYSADPIGSELPKGKSCAQRRSSRDSGLTPTEAHRKNELMRQFLQRDGSQGNSRAYIDNYARTFGHD